MQSHSTGWGLITNFIQWDLMSLHAGIFLDKRILPNLICISSPPVMSGCSGDIDGKQVDFDCMIIVIVKCFNYSRTN